MSTPNLGIPLPTESQAQKTLTIANALDALDEATQGAGAIAITGNRVVTLEEFRSGFSLELTGTPGAPFDLEVPLNKRFFRVENGADDTATVKTSGAGTTVDLQASESRLLYCDGLNISSEGGAVGTAYDMPVMFGGTPLTVEVLGRFKIPRVVNWLANLAGSVGSVETNPTAVFDIDVRDDGASIGTISISTGGVFTFTTSGGTAKVLAAGSKVEFVAPVSTDGTVADITFSILGNL